MLSVRRSIGCVLAGLLFLLAQGCGAATGEPCAIDSDCETGLACSPELECVTYAELQSYMSETEFVSPSEEAFDEQALEAYLIQQGLIRFECGGSADECSDPQGVFAPSTGTCAAPGCMAAVQALTLATEGHGLAKMSLVANAVIPSYFEEGVVQIDLWVDGTFSQDCPHEVQFAQTLDDRNDDCTVNGGDVIELLFPSITEFDVINASIDAATLEITGLVDKEQMLANVPEADPTILGVIENSVEEDVDTDDDGEPDMASIVMTASFTAPEE